ncbi:tumor necrosis factor receptor superfamily member 27 [Trichomycterus rosablanca]|uniref:tumor necrosis factor receptor superfamily member 27 n=1 Tax=Trichomycterus rosablanca TaxID=2290929 RepID=UPI002F357E84
MSGHVPHRPTVQQREPHRDRRARESERSASCTGNRDGSSVSLHGGCQKCPRCPPGHQLRQECGYGLGGGSVCQACERRWFKEDWGSHSCRMCQTCRRLNRREIAACTHTRNAACGDCLPGFYSKRRLDGLQDLECLPCDSAHFRHTQCGSEAADALLRTSEAPPINAAAVMTACVTTVAMVTILLAIVVLTYRFNTLRKSFKGCLSPHSHRDITTASVSVATEYSLTQDGEFGCSDVTFCTRPLAVELSTPISDITSCREARQVTGSSDATAGWGHGGPVECTEGEVLDGERERGGAEVETFLT